MLESDTVGPPCLGRAPHPAPCALTSLSTPWWHQPQHRAPATSQAPTAAGCRRLVECPQSWKELSSPCPSPAGKWDIGCWSTLAGAEGQCVTHRVQGEGLNQFMSTT